MCLMLVSIAKGSRPHNGNAPSRGRFVTGSRTPYYSE
jgi:hypothetical protein